jgi:hypothetical protein
MQIGDEHPSGHGRPYAPLIISTRFSLSGKQEQKKTRLLPAGPWKFWERMPERHDLIAAKSKMLQVRNVHFELQKTQY